MARTMNVIFHLSEDRKYLVEVKRYAYLAHVNKWCTAHPAAQIYIYRAQPGKSHWSTWSRFGNCPMRITSATLLEQCEILNTEPVPFGNPDTWIALSD